MPFAATPASPNDTGSGLKFDFIGSSDDEKFGLLDKSTAHRASRGAPVDFGACGERNEWKGKFAV